VPYRGASAETPQEVVDYLRDYYATFGGDQHAGYTELQANQGVFWLWDFGDVYAMNENPIPPTPAVMFVPQYATRRPTQSRFEVQLESMLLSEPPQYICQTITIEAYDGSGRNEVDANFREIAASFVVGNTPANSVWMHCTLHSVRRGNNSHVPTEKIQNGVICSPEYASIIGPVLGVTYLLGLGFFRVCVIPAGFTPFEECKPVVKIVSQIQGNSPIFEYMYSQEPSVRTRQSLLYRPGTDVLILQHEEPCDMNIPILVNIASEPAHVLKREGLLQLGHKFWG